MSEIIINKFRLSPTVAARLIASQQEDESITGAAIRAIRDGLDSSSLREANALKDRVHDLMLETTRLAAEGVLMHLEDGDLEAARHRLRAIIQTSTPSPTRS